MGSCKQLSRVILLMIYIRISSRTLNDGTSGIFLNMGNEGFISSTVSRVARLILRIAELSTPQEPPVRTQSTQGFHGSGFRVSV